MQWNSCKIICNRLVSVEVYVTWGTDTLPHTLFLHGVRFLKAKFKDLSAYAVIFRKQKHIFFIVWKKKRTSYFYIWTIMFIDIKAIYQLRVVVNHFFLAINRLINLYENKEYSITCFSKIWFGTEHLCAIIKQP